MEIKSYAECLTYSERTVKLNSMRETSRNAPTLKKSCVCVPHHRNWNSCAISDIADHVNSSPVQITFQNSGWGEKKFSRHLEQLSSSEGRVLGISYDIFKAGKSQHNATLDNVLFYVPSKVNSTKTWKYFGIYPEK